MTQTKKYFLEGESPTLNLEKQKNQDIFQIRLFKDIQSLLNDCHVLGLRQILATESPLKMMKNAFSFYAKSSFRS